MQPPPPSPFFKWQPMEVLNRAIYPYFFVYLRLKQLIFGKFIKNLDLIVVQEIALFGIS